jgi:UPF0716 protein FxsA
MKFLLLLLAIPLSEVMVFIKVGGAIGALWTVLLTVGTALLGIMLVRAQGIRTLFKVKDQLAQGQMPAAVMAEGIILLICGAFLLVPGFISDTIGRSMAKGMAESVFVAQAGRQGFVGENDIPGEFTRDNDHKTIEGQFKSED